MQYKRVPPPSDEDLARIAKEGWVLRCVDKAGLYVFEKAEAPTFAREVLIPEAQASNRENFSKKKK
jgi:hypothetical protein